MCIEQAVAQAKEKSPENPIIDGTKRQAKGRFIVKLPTEVKKLAAKSLEV